MVEVITERPRILHDGFHLTECPRWRDGRLYFSDMHGRTVYALTEDGALSSVCKVEGRPGGIGFAANGDLLVNEMETARILRRDSEGRMSVHADLSALVRSINDMITTDDGRCFAGKLTMIAIPDGAPLCTVDPEGRASISASGDIEIANGLVVQRDRKRLIVAESFGCRLLAFDIDAEGTLSKRKVFAELPENHHPDGICGDDEGGIWVASPGIGTYYRVVEGGEITHRFTLDPGRFAYACAMGGADGQTLFLCTGGPFDEERARSTTQGRIETIRAPFPSTQSFP